MKKSTTLITAIAAMIMQLPASAQLQMDVNSMQSQGKAYYYSSPSFDYSTIAKAFDKDFNSMVITPGVNPLKITVVFSEQQTIWAAKSAQATNGKWTLEVAQDTASLTSKTGSYKEVFKDRVLTANVFDSTIFDPVSVKVIRITATRTVGDNYVHLREWGIFANSTVNALAITPAGSLNLINGYKRQLNATAQTTTGDVNVTANATWTSSNTSVATVSAGLVTAMAPGTATITAQYSGKSATTAVTVINDPNSPDLSVRFIKRFPEINYVWASTNPKVQGWPTKGQVCTWRAFVRNWSPNAANNIAYRWKLNGAIVKTGTMNMAANADGTADFDLAWDFKRDTLTFEVDVNNAISEVSEVNNNLKIYTDALSVGLYVERSLYDYFHQYQRNLNIGSNSWDDWAQRQIKIWNEMYQKAIYPETPNGVLDRVRIDNITIVEDAKLPLAGGLATNNPNYNDRTVDYQWGFPSNLLPPNSFYTNHSSADSANPFFYEGSLIHELGHARYLVDGYGFNVHDDADGLTINIKENGKYLAGSSYLPYNWGNQVYQTKFGGLMAGPYNYIDRYGAAALNLIAGNRATLGNYNAPGNIGKYMDDLPAQNQLTFLDQNNNPIANAEIKIYRATYGTKFIYAKYYDSIPDLTLTTDAAGKVLVGRCPFSADGKLNTTPALGVILIRFKTQWGFVKYMFMEVGEFNLKYWTGQTSFANYNLNITLPAVPPMAKFVANKTNICPGQSISFTDQSTGAPTSWSWTFDGGSPATSTSQNPTISFSSPGNHTITLIVSKGGLSTSYSASIAVKQGSNMPYAEGFETTTFPLAGWEIVNPDGKMAWQRAEKLSGGGFGKSKGYMYFDNYSQYNYYQKDQARLAPFDLSHVTSAVLKFDVAYKRATKTKTDTLSVYISTDCGQTFTRIYKKGGSTLSTSAGDKSSGKFMPKSSEWRKEQISLAAYNNMSGIIIAFENTSGYGQPVYIDNIELTGTVSALTSIETDGSLPVMLNVFPNPNAGQFTLNYVSELKDNLNISVINALGQVVYSEEIVNFSGDLNKVINLTDKEKGLFWIKITQQDKQQISKVMVY